MKSAMHGKRTSEVDVTNISKHGFWIFVGERELFVPFEFFPWFRTARIDQILNVELVGENHLYWPELDVDLTIDSIEHPEKYPLVAGFPQAYRK
ncbi:MAG: DUF2442 domain-containing protein [Deltaproteobacteria bacterium]|nr:MAG: DUF2442 domain-containing protein [Deltaproteobacteria bacterium]